MGEFNKDPNQSGTGKEEKGEKPAFEQFEKGQQGQEQFGQEKGQGQQEFGQQKGQGQEFAQGKEEFAQGKDQYAQEKTEKTEGGQQQFEKPVQRQQGDEDLGDDAIDNQNLKSK